MKLLFVVSNFYKEYSTQLLTNSLLELDKTLTDDAFKNIIERCDSQSICRFSLSQYNVTIASIIGSMEIPQAILFCLEKDKYDGVVAIGVIKKGATKHDEYVTNQALNGISHLSLTYKLPITSAIITAHTEDLIKERIEITGYNVGGNAVKSCIHLISLKHKTIK